MKDDGCQVFEGFSGKDRSVLPVSWDILRTDE